MKSAAFTLSCLFVTSCFIGCSEQTSTITDVSITPEVLTSYKSTLGLTEEPEQAVSILDARAATAAADEAHDHEEHGLDHDDHAGHDQDEHGPDHDDHAGHDHDQGHSHDAHGEHIVIVGKIGGAPGAERTSADFPFENGKASFVVHDPSFESPHGAGHEHADGHDCHFCQTKAYDAQAFVSFLGEDGKPLPVDARELFDIKENDIVVIKGHARMKTGLLMIDGEGLYVRR